MADEYTCNCGNQTWQIFDTVIRCASCKREFFSQHTPAAEFNHAVAQEVEEELEEA
jgi:hypothetical protein